LKPPKPPDPIVSGDPPLRLCGQIGVSLWITRGEPRTAVDNVELRGARAATMSHHEPTTRPPTHTSAGPAPAVARHTPSATRDGPGAGRAAGADRSGLRPTS